MTESKNRELCEVKVTRGKIHDHVGMRFDFSEPGKVKVDMIDNVKEMLDDFSVDLSQPTLHLHHQLRICLQLEPVRSWTLRDDEFHTFVMTGVCWRIDFHHNG
jgi:hypothetical protein